MENETKSILEVIAEMADFANAVASMVVGHRRILVEGGFDINLADSMAAALHAQTLGLVHHWDTDEDNFEIVAYMNDDEDDE